MVKNKVYCKVNSQSEIDEICSIIKDNDLDAYSLKNVIMATDNFNKGYRYIVLTNDNFICFDRYRFKNKDYTLLTLTEFINNLKSNNMNENEIKLPDEWSLNHKTDDEITFNVKGCNIKITNTNKEKRFEYMENKTITLKDKAPKVKPLIEYIRKWYENRRGAISYFSTGTTPNELLKLITKGEAIDILQLIANDLNGGWEPLFNYGTVNYYFYFAENCMYIACHKSIVLGVVYFKDNQTAQFILNNYIDLLNKIKES